jgi:hypothetical protein
MFGVTQPAYVLSLCDLPRNGQSKLFIMEIDKTNGTGKCASIAQ